MTIDKDTIGPFVRLMDEEPRSASRVDVARAMSDGRRLRRMHRVTLSTAAAAAVAAIAFAVPFALGGVVGTRPPTAAAKTATAVNPPATAASVTAIPTYQPVARPPSRAGVPPVPASCTGRFLPLPQGVGAAIITDGDSTGRYLVGYATDRAHTYQPILWTDGTPTLLDADASFGPPVVNSHGEVAGSGITTDGSQNEWIAWTYRDGTVTRLLHGDTSYMVAGINDNGDVLAIPMPRFEDGTQDAPFVPLSPVVLNGDNVRHLDTVPYEDATLFQGGIGNDGTVVGGENQSGNAYVWDPQGHISQLTGPSAYSYASSTRNGFVLGGSGRDNPDLPGLFLAARWDLGTGKAKSFHDVTLAAGATITSSGWFAGKNDKGPVAVFGGTVRQLPRVPGAVDWTQFAFAVTMSDDGHIIGGQADRTADDIGAVEWTCH
ncbi:MAG TPA: hypothetical protein VFR11_12360 [Micromonosporaceae bacterium]|jgi:hypothetical protein|nr:hypothetical protein [Micromonosporaceae bacterium]